MKPNAIRLAKEVLSSRRKRADGGTDEWQSTGKLINDDDSVNWGSPDIASDFFRADKEDLRRRKEAERDVGGSDEVAPRPRTAEGRQMAPATVAQKREEESAGDAPLSVPEAPPGPVARMPLIPGATPIVEDKFGPMPPAMQATANGFSPANYKEALTDEQRQALALEQWKAAGRSGTPDNPNPAPPANPLVQASLTTPEPKQTATDANRAPMRFAPVPGTEPPAPAAAPTSAILAAIRSNESRNKPTAQNPRSSAGGLYQFLDSTWGNTLRRMDPQQYGKFSDRQLRSLKTDPRYVDLQHSAADFMLNKDIAPRLEKAGIPLTPGSAYLSWFQGPAGAVKTYTAPDNATVAQVFPKTVSANSNMRFNGKSYANWTMSDLRQWADTKMAQRMQPTRAPLRFAPSGYEEGGRVGYANEGAVEDEAVYSPMGDVFVPPQAPEGAKESLYDRAMQSIRPPEDSRIWEGMKRGFGDQPLGGHDRPQDVEFRKENPIVSSAYDSLMKPAAAVMRAPGAIIGGLAGAGASAYEAMGAPGGDQNLSPEARTNRLERDLFALGNVGAIEAGNVRPKAPTYTDAIPRGGDVLPPLPRDALPAPERAAPPTIEGNHAALEAPRKALPAPTVVEAAMEKVPERPNPLAEYETIEKFESLNDPVAPAVQKAKEVVQPAFSPVNPEGNLNLRPSITVDQLRGPERQTIDSFLSQLKGKPGFTADSIVDIARQFDDPRAVVSKSEFEKAIPASQFEKVDLVSPKRDTDVSQEEFVDILRDAVESNIADAYFNYFADNYGVRLNRNDLVDLDNFNRGNLSFEDLPQQVRDELTQGGISTERDLAANLAEAYDEAYQANFDHYADIYTVYDEDNLDMGKYKYQDYQRLVADPEGHSEGYAEIGVAHPKQRGGYHHYGSYSGDKGLVGHFRRTNLPEGGDLVTGAFDMGDYNNNFEITTPPQFQAKPKSTVIEEIQSDSQQTTDQTGPLRQVHGTVFKAAIQDALESGSTTVYMPTAKAIKAVRSLKPDAERTLTKIYDDSIRKEGLQPLSKIPGVTIKKVADGAYHEIDFTPEAVQHILKGPGQRSPGHARGGTVDRAMNVSRFGTDAVQKAVNLARQHRGRPETPRSTS